MFLIFDTETTGLPKDFSAPISDTQNWPRCIQLAWQLHNSLGELIETKNYIIKPDGFSIPFNSQKIHGISTERALNEGWPIDLVLKDFSNALSQTQYFVGHNILFDLNIIFSEFFRLNQVYIIEKENRTYCVKKEEKIWSSLDTMTEKTANFCQIPGGRSGKFKFPKLTELYEKLFNKIFEEAHNASADVAATARSFFELLRIGLIENLDTDLINKFQQKNTSTINEYPTINNIIYQEKNTSIPNEEESKNNFKDEFSVVEKNSTSSNFFHMHCHTHYSILQSTASIEKLVSLAVKYNMKALAITDLGNLFGCFKFVKLCQENNIKPIIGCEFFLTEDHTKKTFTKQKRDKRVSQIFYAKNTNGYKNLSKLCSSGYISGMYAGIPRIDKSLVLQFKEDLIVTSSGINGEIADVLLNQGEEHAEDIFVWWKENFGEDFYVQLTNHGLEEEKYINKILLNWCNKYKVSFFVSNEIFYPSKEDANSHDVLLCVKNSELKSTPIGKGRGYRFGYHSDDYFFKSSDEMLMSFNDIPNPFSSFEEIYNKIDEFKLEKDVALPLFQLPDEFANQDEYLKFLTLEGARRKYQEIDSDLNERILFELDTIKKTGYPGYFLIVQDITSQARKMGVSVGPGRGSAAGSVVAYCLGITNVDPIKYGLLFERFLNPDRVSLPDIDIDFDDEGRSNLINWIVNKYGINQVAQIITFGTMAAKSSIRDVARVLNLELSQADKMAKMVPWNISLKKILNAQNNNDDLKSKLNRDDLYKVNELQKILKKNDLSSEVLKTAAILEGSIRNIGTHACGMIIAPENIQEIIPVGVSTNSMVIKNSNGESFNLPTTQFDNSVVESAGLLKMDFLGLKTLSIINDSIKMIKERHGININTDEINLEDPKTYDLYKKGETNGTFQFESVGMQRYLRLLKPDKFEDLIAMNALYRPGPLEYIPKFINRKHGKEKIEYDLPEMEEYLKDTYGITVYQEQVMLLSQSLAGFSKGDADILRKAMGKKNKVLLDELKEKFFNGCKKNNHSIEKVQKIWSDWESFAAYAFNKSHSTCYSVLAFYTAYLKAHYPSEFMSSVLTHHINDIKKLGFYLEECKRMSISILGPDINESFMQYSVNSSGQIRFGLEAIKGVGSAAAEFIINERKKNGNYADIFDFFKRMDSRLTNKRVFEALVLGGGFDSLTNSKRSIFFNENEKNEMFLERLIKFGSAYRKQKQVPTLIPIDESISIPKIPNVDSWDHLIKLKKEKEILGMYISGHPLDNYFDKIKFRCNSRISDLSDLSKLEGKKISIGGMILSFEERVSNKNSQQKYGVFLLEDFSSTKEFRLYRNYSQFSHLLKEGEFVQISILVKRNDYSGGLFIQIDEIKSLNRPWQYIRIKYPIDMNLDLLEFEKIINNNKGKVNLKIDFFDLEKNISVSMVTKKNGIKLTKNLLKKIKEFGIKDYFLN